MFSYPNDTPKIGDVVIVRNLPPDNDLNNKMGIVTGQSTDYTMIVTFDDPVDEAGTTTVSLPFTCMRLIQRKAD